MDQEIIDYIVISDTELYRFETEIKRLLASGWSVYGNVAHGYTDDSVGRRIYSVQVLVKYKQSP